jgi:hypothetical protein
MHEMFENLFKGGAEYRQLMHSEASAAILRVVSGCIETLKSLCRHGNYSWSDDLKQSADYIKMIIIEEHKSIFNQWRHESAVEKAVSMKNTLYPRITLSETAEFKDLIEEETNLMEYFKGYVKMFSSSTSVKSADRHAIHSEAVALQAIRVTTMLIRVIDQNAAKKIQCHLERPILNSKRLFMGLANDWQKFEILSRLQEEEGLDSKGVISLSNETIYVMSHQLDADKYHGFFLVDRPLHLPADTHQTVWISHFKISPSHKESLLRKEVMKWIKSTARKSGFRALISKSLKPSMRFWLDHGFVIQTRQGLATFNLDPMSIENIVSKA